MKVGLTCTFTFFLSFSLSLPLLDFPLLLPLGFFPLFSLLFSLSAEDQVCKHPSPPSMLLCHKDTDIPYVISLRLMCVCVCLHELSSSGPSHNWYYTPSPPAGPETGRRDQQTQFMGKQRVLCYQGNQTSFSPNQPDSLSRSLSYLYT